MYSLLVSVAAGLVVWLIVGYFYSVLAGFMLGLLVALGIFFLFARKYFDLLQEISAQSMKKLESLQDLQSKVGQVPQLLLEQQRDHAMAEAVKVLEDGLVHGKWMFLFESQLSGQIGYIHYLGKKYDLAFPYLQKTFSKNYLALLMLAACYHRKKELPKLEETLARAAKHNKDTPLVWAVYGWFMKENGKIDKCLEVLDQGTKACPSDQTLKTLLLSQQNKKPLDMKLMGDIWYQLYLEELPVKRVQAMQTRFVPPSHRRRR
ncbi:MAG: tetratricopeptide repeat protein [Myxococcota bacterium]